MKLSIKKGLITCVTAFALLAIANTSSAQNPNYGEERVMFVEIQGLDAYSYGAIATAIKDNDDLSIRQSCVPGKMIMFDVDNESNESLDLLFQQVKSITLTAINPDDLTDLDDLVILAEYTEEQFLTRCAMFRTSSPE